MGSLVLISSRCRYRRTSYHKCADRAKVAPGSRGLAYNPRWADRTGVPSSGGLPSGVVTMVLAGTWLKKRVGKVPWRIAVVW